MIGIFLWRKANSVTKAKERLRSVIKNDRITTVDNTTLEKIRKDVFSVLLRYTKDAESLSVNVSTGQGQNIILNATVGQSKELNNEYSFNCT